MKRSKIHHLGLCFKYPLLGILLFLPFSILFAESEIYGSIRYDLQSSKSPRAIVINPSYIPQADLPLIQKGIISSQNQRTSGLEDAGSKIGIKGRHDIGEGNAIIYQLEWGPDGLQ